MLHLALVDIQLESKVTLQIIEHWAEVAQVFLETKLVLSCLQRLINCVQTL